MNNVSHIAFMTESGDTYYIPSDIYDEEVQKYYNSVATDWVYATECEEGKHGWVYLG